MRRRHFIATAAAWFIAACSRNDSASPAPSATTSSTVGPTSQPATTAAPTTDTAPAVPAPTPSPTFALGVGSGDPDHRSVVLWTRVTDSSSEPVDVAWEVAADPEFTTTRASGAVTADADAAFTVRAVVDGLDPASTWFYRFRVGEAFSPIGRTRTLPAPDAVPARFRMAVSSCQLLTTGHWAAHRDLAAADVDLVVWLGDYIYSRGASSDLAERSHRGGDAVSLDDYRDRYAQYREDPSLQAAHAAHPWVLTWDDNEVVNDYDSAVDVGRRNAAYRAWWEHQAVALPAPDADGLRIHRTLDVGRLLRLMLVDVRQHATATALLGEGQWQWLDSQFTGEAAWTAVASPVLVSGLNAPDTAEGAALPYAWGSYTSEQQRLIENLAGTDSFVMSGDLHTAMTLDLKADLAADQSTTACPEFMAPAISSAFPTDLAPFAPFLGLLNPQLRSIDPTNGWLLLDITPDEVIAEFRAVDDVTDPESGLTVTQRFSLAAGNPVATEVA